MNKEKLLKDNNHNKLSEDTVTDEVELSYEEKIQGQPDCLKKMNGILRGAIKRHESK